MAKILPLVNTVVGGKSPNNIRYITMLKINQKSKVISAAVLTPHSVTQTVFSQNTNLISYVTNYKMLKHYSDKSMQTLHVLSKKLLTPQIS